MQITERDRAILLALTHKVRLLSLHQIARTWWNETESGLTNTRKRLSLLATGPAPLIRKLQVNAHPELNLVEPLFIWSPGEPAPHFGALSYRLKSRWTEAPKPTTVYIATQTAVRQFGGWGGKLKRPLQVTHDLHLSQIYLLYLKHRPLEVEHWMSEESIALDRLRQKLPDAELRDSQGNTTLVIEFAGAYDAQHVKRVHEDCLKRSLPYELW